MRKKHFEAIARALLFSKDSMTPRAFRLLCERIASEVQIFNPNFDRERFLRSCGVED